MIIIAIILILFVLIQNSKGGGLASNFAGSQIMGVRKTADFLEKATWTLVGVLLFLCILSNIIKPGNTSTNQKSVLEDEIQNIINPNNVPKIPAPQQQQGQTNQPAAPQQPNPGTPQK
jgi:preprotein translocase subunit SecG